MTVKIKLSQQICLLVADNGSRYRASPCSFDFSILERRLNVLKFNGCLGLHSSETAIFDKKKASWRAYISINNMILVFGMCEMWLLLRSRWLANTVASISCNLIIWKYLVSISAMGFSSKPI